METLLSFNKVHKDFYSKEGETKVLDDVSFSLHEDEIIAIIGPSGCGKSTILNLASSLMSPTSGDISINGNLGYMFQRDNLFSWRTVLDNVLLGLQIQKKANKENRKYALDLLKKYQLEDFINYYPEELSGGMRQRVALIRTLALKPDLLLLDEPFSALDYQTRLLVLNDVYSIIKNEKKSVVVVTHDIGEAISIADRIIILSKRPCHIKKEIKIKLTLNGEKTPIKARKAKEFRKYFDEIYKELHEDE